MGDCDSVDADDGDVQRLVSSLLGGLWIVGLRTARGEFVQYEGQTDFIAAVQFFVPGEPGCLVDEFGVGHSASDVLH